MSEWQESGRPSVKLDKDTLLEHINLNDLRLTENKKYQSIVRELQGLHAELIALEREGKIDNFRDNPILVGQYLTKIRLKANQLFAFINVFYDVLSDLEMEVAQKREEIFREAIRDKNSSANKAEKMSSELTRTDRAKVDTVKHLIKQVENEYERYNGICMSLQSRMKEFASEKFMG